VYLFTHILVPSKSIEFVREADRIDVLRNSGYPESVIQWSIDLTPEIARKYADLPAIMLSRKLKKEGLKISRYDRDPRVKKLVLSVLSHDDHGIGTGLRAMMGDVMDSIAWLMSKNKDFGIDLYNSTEYQLQQWGREIHEFMKRYSVSDPSQYTGPVVYTDDDGWTINELTPEDCEIEGDLMEHCVGGYAYNISSGDSRIFSLRDPRGMPHMTMEFRVEKYIGDNNTEKTTMKLVQSKGHSNHHPKDTYIEVAKEWLESVDGENGVDFVDARDQSDVDFEGFSYYRGWTSYDYNELDYGIEQEKPEDPLLNYDYEKILEIVNDEMPGQFSEEGEIIHGVLEYVYDYRNIDEFKQYLRDFIEQTTPADIDVYKHQWVREHTNLEEPIRMMYNTDEEFQRAATKYEMMLQSVPAPVPASAIAMAITADKILSSSSTDNASYLIDPDRPWVPARDEDKNQLWLPFSSSNYIFLR